MHFSYFSSLSIHYGGEPATIYATKGDNVSEEDLLDGKITGKLPSYGAIETTTYIPEDSALNRIKIILNVNSIEEDSIGVDKEVKAYYPLVSVKREGPDNEKIDLRSFYDLEHLYSEPMDSGPFVFHNIWYFVLPALAFTGICLVIIHRRFES